MFARIGQGHRRESDCKACSHTFTIKASCVESLGSCKSLCASATGRKGIAFAANPPNETGHVDGAHVVCAQVQKARCVNRTEAMSTARPPLYFQPKPDSAETFFAS